MEEKKYPIKWEYKIHSYPIGDTGDYDGYWEIANGKDSMITKDDYDDIEKDLQAIVDMLNITYANFSFDRNAEAALEAENKWLKQECEELRKAHPGAVWVKASERLPEKDGYYCFKANGGYMGAYLRTATNGSRWFCDSAGGTIRNWKNCEWLDESTPAGITQAKADLTREANNRDLEEASEVDKEVLEFIRDIAYNWDCDEDGHKYNTGCRKCTASELYHKLSKEQKEK